MSWARGSVLAAALGAVLVATGCSTGSAADVSPTTPTTAGATTSVAPTPGTTTPGTPSPGTSIGPGPTVGPTAPEDGSQSPQNFPDADRLAFPNPTTDLPTITVDRLPAEAVVTLGLIRDGGPFPYPQDGMIFSNRERELPGQPAGFYHEYTVPTPGSPDRGARRIVAGADGAKFWTIDHYRSFREIIEPWT